MSSTGPGAVGVKQPLLFLALNEVNFEYVERYISWGELPTFRALFERYGYELTTSEQEYHLLEPWIQWVTAHTGCDFAEHGVLRLGDIVDHDRVQVWEMLEERGMRTGAVCPMNAKLRLRDAAFFVPDPWTPTGMVVPEKLRALVSAIFVLVNENASGAAGWRSFVDLALGTARVASPRSYVALATTAIQSLRNKWFRPIFLDRLLFELYCFGLTTTKPDFASVFLNAAAHIQHHYMFSSRAYDGEMRNPRWYAKPGDDPLLDVYRSYDQILGAVIQRFPQHRVMLATGLHQDPYGKVTYYWRLRDHAAFLRQIGVDCQRVEPRMSRDFRVVFTNPRAADVAARALTDLCDGAGVRLFDVDNRGDDLFVTLTYPLEIRADTTFRLGEVSLGALAPHVAFVAIKNGQHNGTGYFLDTGQSVDASGRGIRTFLLREVPQRIIGVFDERKRAHQ